MNKPKEKNKRTRRISYFLVTIVEAFKTKAQAEKYLADNSTGTADVIKGVRVEVEEVSTVRIN